MKASPRQQRLLLQLQQLDTAIARQSRKLSSIPERAELDGLAGALSLAKTRLLDAQRELDLQNAELNRVAADAQTVRERLARDQQLLAASTSPKEAQSLQSEVEALTRRQRELEDREFACLEQQESAGGAFRSAEAELAGIELRRTELQTSIQRAEAEIRDTTSALQDERAGTAAEIQRDLLEHYEALRDRLGIGVARLRGNVSEASNMALAPAELSDLLSVPDDELAYCPGTGAILVRGADDGDAASS